MTFCHRFQRNITLHLICHLLLLVSLFTSRLLRAQSTPEAPSATVATQDDGELVTITAVQQEKAGDLYKLHGNVEIDFRDFKLQADEIVYDAKTGDVTATGHLVLDGGPHDEHLSATSGQYNIRTQQGEFHDVIGTAGIRFRGKNVQLTTDQPFVFSGVRVEKTGKSHYVVYDGKVTSCQLPDPKWTFNAGRVEIDLAGSSRIYNSTFRVRDIPVFYFPYASHTFGKLGRQTGFLIPSAGVSSRKGTILGESIYWAINRSMDATLGAEYYSSRGWAQHGEFRAKPSEASFINATYFGVLDRGFGPTKIDQGGEDMKISAAGEMPHGIRAVVSAEYLSSYLFRQAFTETFSQAVNSEVKSLGFLTKSYKGFFFNGVADRYQNFQSTNDGDVITIVRAPGIEINSVDHKIGSSPLYWSFNGTAQGMERSEPGFKTDGLVGRFDVQPRLSLPLFFRGWTLRPEVALRNTYYTKQLAPTRTLPAENDLNRRAIDASAELRPPTLGRIFQKPVFGRTLKHTIEPHFIYRIVNGVSQFKNVLRFDERDILSDTSEFEYGLTQRLFLKNPHSKPCESAPEKICDNGPHEFLSWEVAQRYYFDTDFGHAVVTGQRNVLTSTVDFTGIAFLTEPRNYSPVVSRLRVRATGSTDASWQLDYDTKKGQINASTVFVNYRHSDYFLGGSYAFLRTPGEVNVTTPVPSPIQFNQFRVMTGFGSPTRRGLNSAAALGFDANQNFLQYASFQNSYNWDCCGISVEYRRFALGSVRNENQFRFAFTLANIGTFGNLRRQERLF